MADIHGNQADYLAKVKAASIAAQNQGASA